MKIEEVRTKLIANGVKNLHESGYTNATANNILTDEIYAAFFRGMLESNLGHGLTIDSAINQLLAELETKHD